MLCSGTLGALRTLLSAVGTSAGCKSGPAACSRQVGQGSHDPTAHAKSGANIFPQFGENQTFGQLLEPLGWAPTASGWLSLVRE